MRQGALLLTGSPASSEKMQGYKDQITKKPLKDRSMLEQLFIGSHVVNETPHRPVRCEPRPVQAPSYFPYLITSVVLGVTVLVLLLLLSRKNDWRVAPPKSIQD